MKKTSILSKFLFIATIAISFSLPAFSQQQKQIKPHNPYGKILTEQEKQEKRDSIVNNSDYILSGGRTAIQFHFRDKENNVYEVRRLYVDEVLRGPKELRGKDIYIIQKTKEVKYVPETTHCERFRVANYIAPMYSEGVSGGVYFLKKNNFMLDAYLKDTSYINMGLCQNYTESNVPFGMDTMMYRRINAPDRILCEFTSNLVRGITLFDLNNGIYKGLYQKEFIGESAIYNFLVPYGNIYVSSQAQAQIDFDKRVDSLRQQHLLQDTIQNKKKVTPEEQAEFDLWLRGGRPATPQPSRLKSTNDPIVDCEFFADYQHIS